MATQCKATTRTGARCTAYAGSDGYCFTHSPEHAQARARAHRRGGRKRAVPKVAGAWARKIESIGDLVELLNLVVLDTWQQENTAARSRALLAAIETGIKCLTEGEIEERLAAVEAVLKTREVKP